MDLKQTLSDLGLLLRHNRALQVTLVGLLLLMVIMSLNDNGRPGYASAAPETATKLGEDREAYEDLLTAFSDDVRTIRENTEENRRLISETRKDLEQGEEQTAEILKKMIERIADLEHTSVGPVNSTEVSLSGGAVPDIEATVVEPDSLESFGAMDAAEVLPPPDVLTRKVAFIGAGDSVRVELLAGVNAPTDGTPYPTLFKLVDNVNGPDGSALPIGEARLIAAAQGSLADRRALFRLTSINIALPDGSREVVDVDGWIVGEDGIRGMEGLLIDPLGKILAGQMTAGFAEGLGDGVSDLGRTSIYTDGSLHEVVDGDLMSYALGRGLGQSGREYSDIIEDRANQLVPHVKVLSGRRATAVFSRNVEIERLLELMDERSVYASLD